MKAIMLCIVVGSTPIGLAGFIISCVLSRNCDNVDALVPRRALGPPWTLVATAVDCAEIEVRTRGCELGASFCRSSLIPRGEYIGVGDDGENCVLPASSWLFSWLISAHNIQLVYYCKIQAEHTPEVMFAGAAAER